VTREINPYLERKIALIREKTLVNAGVGAQTFLKIDVPAGHVITIERVWGMWFSPSVPANGGDVELGLIQQAIEPPLSAMTPGTFWYKCIPFNASIAPNIVTNPGVAPTIERSAYYYSNDELNITLSGGTPIYFEFFSVLTNICILMVAGVSYRIGRDDAYGVSRG
jgi:hypothetical protein